MLRQSLKLLLKSMTRQEDDVTLPSGELKLAEVFSNLQEDSTGLHITD